MRPPEEQKEEEEEEEEEEEKEEEQVEATWQSDGTSWRGEWTLATLQPNAPPQDQVTLCNFSLVSI